jgi:hypothetical protein
MRRALLHATFAGLAGALLLACTSAPAPVLPADQGPAMPQVDYLTRQEILTPLPLRVKLPARYGAERVLVFVRTWGSRDWTTIELARNGQTWSGEVSCRAVSTVTGDTRYFFLALDANGRTVVGSGSPGWPVVATIVGKLPDGPQALPGDAPPAHCHDVADCPPDFLGCPAYTTLRPYCLLDEDCPNGRRCMWDSYCEGLPETIAVMSEEEQLAAAVRAATARYRAAAVR